MIIVTSGRAIVVADNNSKTAANAVVRNDKSDQSDVVLLEILP